jgi:hypothetical protein
LTDLIRCFKSVSHSARVEVSYVERGLDFLCIGASSKNSSDSLLANMMCLEALFGVKDGTIASISAGITHVYAGSATNGRGECQYFKKSLYEGRSRLIHGDIGPGELKPEWAIIARVMARDSVAWTLRRLSEIDQILQESGTAVKFGREQFLTVLRIPPHDLSLHRMIIGRVP